MTGLNCFIFWGNYLCGVHRLSNLHLLQFSSWIFYNIQWKSLNVTYRIRLFTGFVIIWTTRRVPHVEQDLLTLQVSFVPPLLKVCVFSEFWCSNFPQMTGCWPCHMILFCWHLYVCLVLFQLLVHGLFSNSSYSFQSLNFILCRVLVLINWRYAFYQEGLAGQTMY